MNDNLPPEIWKFLDRHKHPSEHEQQPKSGSGSHLKPVYLRIQSVPVQSVEKYISLASSVIMRPSLTNPKIFDSRLSRGKTFFASRIEPFITRAAEERVRQIFDKQILPEDYEFLQSLQIARVVLLRRVTRRDHVTYLVLEAWDLVGNTVGVFPMDMVSEEPDSTLLRDKELPYSIAYANQNLELECMVPDPNNAEARAWAHLFLDKLTIKLNRWANEPIINANTWKTFTRSNYCVHPSRYLDTYDTLKMDHYSKLCKVWKNVANSTAQEMEKDIHEDLAIAAYLHNAIPYITNKNQGYYIKSFVDLGCGNGLLTYLLTSLNWIGYGIDCRRRALWELLGQEKKSSKKTKHAKGNLVAGVKQEYLADLREMVIDPKETQFNKDNTRLFIGNHPDELTPWIPFVARKSQSNFIIIPCCPYKFDGTKFRNTTKMRKVKIENAKKKQQEKVNESDNLEMELQKKVDDQEGQEGQDHHDSAIKNGGLQPNSTYQQYLGFIEEIAVECGYKVIIDRLRIPSTRRVAIFGLYDPKQPRNRLEKSVFWPDIERGLSWFKPPKLPEIKNCSTLSKQDLERIVFSIFKFIVSEGSPTKMYVSNDSDMVEWNRGAQNITLDMIIYDVLNSNDRAIFRSQAKGLQTLLKNYGHIFQITNGNGEKLVKLRVPAFLEIELLRDRSKLYTKPCYYYINHPNGCPLPDGRCKFNHTGLTKCTENIEAVEQAIKNRDPNREFLGKLGKPQALNVETEIKEDDTVIDLSELKIFD